MSKFIITCLSKQTLPNFLLIKTFFEEGDTIYFITTDKFKDTAPIREALAVNNYLKKAKIKQLELKDGIEDTSFIKIVEEFNKNFSENKETKYIVNLTGGNKLESLALFDVFKDKDNAILIYKPISKNKFFNLIKENEDLPINHQMDVKEFLYLAGINEIRERQYHFDDEGMYAEKIFGKFNSFTEKERDYIKSLETAQKDEPAFISFFTNIEFPKKIADINNRDKKYLTKNEWFEEYTTKKLQDNFKDIKIYNGRIKYQDDIKDNELDCVFTLNNELFIVECKTVLDHTTENKWLESAIAKAQRIKDKLGHLSVHFYFFYIKKEGNTNEIDKSIHDAERNERILFFNNTDELIFQIKKDAGLLVNDKDSQSNNPDDVKPQAGK